MRTFLAIAIAVLSLGGSCQEVNPKTGPGTDWPCGTQGHSCGNHMCCWNDEDCGGGNFNGCPAGMCCYNGGDSTLSAKKNHPQISETEAVQKK